ncbi:hypothetical protein ACOBV8_21960 (plasmid) [Pseudoalteromonas espejiana]
MFGGYTVVAIILKFQADVYDFDVKANTYKHLASMPNFY